MKLSEYYDMLEAFDWYFEWSDDINVRRQGRLAADVLIAAATQSSEHEALFKAYWEHKLGPSGATPTNATGPGLTPKVPKPKRPVE